METSAVAGATQLLQQTQSTVMMKKAADAQMLVANMIAQQVQQVRQMPQGNPDHGFAVYA